VANNRKNRIRLLNVVKLIIYTLFAIFLLSGFYFYFYPKSLDKIGLYMMSKYEKKGQKDYYNALNYIENNNLAASLKILNNWSEIKKGDRLYDRKRELFFKLTKKMFKNEDYLSVLTLSKKFLTEDERDLDIFCIWAKSALKIKTSKNKLYADIRNKWEMFPNKNCLTIIYYNIILNENINFNDFYSIYFNKQITEPWYYYTNYGNGYQNNWKQVWLKRKLDRYYLELILPSNTISIRIDPSNGLIFHLTDLKIVTKEYEKDIDVSKIYGLHMAKKKDQMILTKGGNDPFFSINIENILKRYSDKNDIRLVLSFKLETFLINLKQMEKNLSW
jgi:hypothetical protein